MPEYFLAPALEKLREEVNLRYPKRDKASDGWLGDASHAARKSEHNPCWSCTGRSHGIVRALDTDIDDNNPDRDVRRDILNAAIGDHRVWYVISNGVIYSRTHGWRALKYNGANGHFHHVHVSLLSNDSNFDESNWFEPEKVRVTPGGVNLTNMIAQFRAARGLEDAKAVEVVALDGVRRIQDSLNHKYNAGLTVDGYVGEATLRAYARHEKARGGTGRSGIPDAKSLPTLIGPEYSMFVGGGERK